MHVLSFGEGRCWCVFLFFAAYSGEIRPLRESVFWISCDFLMYYAPPSPRMRVWFMRRFDFCVLLLFSPVGNIRIYFQRTHPFARLTRERDERRQFHTPRKSVYERVCVFLTVNVKERRWASDLGIGFWLRGVQPRTTTR